MENEDTVFSGDKNSLENCSTACQELEFLCGFLYTAVEEHCAIFLYVNRPFFTSSQGYHKQHFDCKSTEDFPDLDESG